MRQLLLLLTTLAVIFCVALSLLQRKLIYFPTHLDSVAKGGDGFLPLQDDDGSFVGYVKEAVVPSGMLIFFHGNGGEALHRSWIAGAVPSASITIILAEYPGYGARQGKPSQRAIEQAALELFDLAVKRFEIPVTLLGESLGTGVATFVAAERPATRLALISPFTSLVAVANFHYPFLPVRLLLADRFPSEENLTRTTIPLQIIHGDNDAIVPYELGQTLFENYGGSEKKLITLPGVGHNDIAGWILQSELAEEFRQFLAAD